MPSHLRRPPPGLFRVVRVAGDAARSRQAIRFLGVERTEAAVRAHRLRATLHRAAELAAAMPCARRIHDLAREAAQNPKAGLAGLRRGLEEVMALAAGRRAPEVHDLARDELGATYLIAG